MRASWRHVACLTWLMACSGTPDDTKSDDITPDDTTPDDTPVAAPEVCTDDNAGACDCSEEPGFTTYVQTVDGQSRCFTVYVPPERATPLPLVITMDCYAANDLGALGCVPNSPMVRAANQHGFAGLCASSTDGNWTFGNDGVIHDDEPTPCAREDSKDIHYLEGMFQTVDALAGDSVIDPASVYTWGFSQNAMFAVYTAVCFEEQVTGVWQGGSGLYVAGETAPLPQMEGACRASDFQEYGDACEELAPCEECQYFPVYPVSSDPPLQACVMAYEDDFLFETARPMYERMSEEGHDATLLSFPEIGRGHAGPLDNWSWIVGCLDVVPSCSETCSDAFVSCVSSRGGDGPEERLQSYRQCFAGGSYRNLDGCTPGCSATFDMLSTVESPAIE